MKPEYAHYYERGSKPGVRNIRIVIPNTWRLQRQFRSIHRTMKRLMHGTQVKADWEFGALDHMPWRFPWWAPHSRPYDQEFDQ